MKINMIVLFVVTAFLMASSFSKISYVLSSFFANNFSIENVSSLIFMIIYLAIFITSVAVLNFYKSKGSISNAAVKMTYAVFITYSLAMIIPVIFHIIFLKLFGLESSQLYGFQNSQDHTMALVFIQLIILMFLFFSLKGKVSTKENNNAKL